MILTKRSGGTFRNKALEDLPSACSAVKAILGYRGIPATVQKVVEGMH